MINIEFLKKQISAMDVKSEQFFELYKVVSDKYWTVENPDHYQQCVKALVMYAERGDPAQVTTAVKIIEQLFMMEKDKISATMGTLSFEHKDYHFTLCTNKKDIEEMTDLMGEILKGNFKIKNKSKKK